MYYYPSDNQVFITHSDIRRYFKWVFFPAEIEQSHLEYMEIYPLIYVEPEVGVNQIAEPSEVTNVDGQWVQQWTIRDRTPEEMPDPEPEPDPIPEDPPVDPEPVDPVQSGN